ncbi:minor tail protein [Gordonia phage YorkOnyx]|uniref:Minor tail protein n=1 Tax=Gordonia phage YorkOnyx TaxID=2762402 RepID=A0A7G8LM89_9CAUD|nr:minor tail protein [Gordonia phage YorkOnyx]QNJ58361.1 minor tail protein [Gordonia phage YorkOnyx]
MAYAAQTWLNKPATTTPISAARLNHIESGISGAHTIAEGAVAALAGKADLDGNGRLRADQVPDIAIVDYLGSVASQAAMLALVGQKGDWAIRSDLGTVWIITGSTPTNPSSWTQTAYPASPVASVAGKVGAVELVKGDVGLGAVDNTADSAKSVASAAKWTTTRTIRTNLGSTATSNIDGTSNVTPGVTGTLPIGNGGTGSTTAAGAQTALGLDPLFAAKANASDVSTALATKANTADVADALAGKVAISTTPNRLYGTGSDGSPNMWAVSSSATSTTVALRGTGGVLNVGTATAPGHAPTKQQLDDAVAAAQLAIVNAQPAGYTLALTDAGKAIEVTSASAVAVTVPPDSSVAFPVGTIIELAQTGAGQLSVAAGSGVTLRTAASLAARVQWSTITLRKRAANDWIVAGDLS